MANPSKSAPHHATKWLRCATLYRVPRVSHTCRLLPKPCEYAIIWLGVAEATRLGSSSLRGVGYGTMPKHLRERATAARRRVCGCPAGRYRISTERQSLSVAGLSGGRRLISCSGTRHRRPNLSTTSYRHDHADHSTSHEHDPTVAAPAAPRKRTGHASKTTEDLYASERRARQGRKSRPRPKTADKGRARQRQLFPPVRCTSSSRSTSSAPRSTPTASSSRAPRSRPARNRIRRRWACSA